MRAGRRSERRSARFGPSKLEAALARLGTPTDVLKRHGVAVRGRMAKCPLHDDRTPSLSLYRGRDGRERWKCHGCDAGGDALDLEAALSKRSVRDLVL
jgi:hypothetical protein